jgi:hypothetical protein
MPDLSLVDKVVRLVQALERAGVPFAVGGALAFAYYGEPRATIDVDLNLFVAPSRYGRIIKILEPLGVTPAADATVVQRDGQVRLWWGRTPLDLFFSYDPVHEAMRDGIRQVPFSTITMPILGPEHLLVAKVAFDRAKDWIDVAQMLVAVPALDLDGLHRWLDRLVGSDDERHLHLLALEHQLLSSG